MVSRSTWVLAAALLVGCQSAKPESYCLLDAAADGGQGRWLCVSTQSVCDRARKQLKTLADGEQVEVCRPAAPLYCTSSLLDLYCAPSESACETQAAVAKAQGHSVESCAPATHDQKAALDRGEAELMRIVEPLERIRSLRQEVDEMKKDLADKVDHWQGLRINLDEIE